MNPRDAARVMAMGRVALGAALLVAPGRVARGWLGDLAERPAMHSVLRGFGARDAVIGMIALHTLDNPQVGPRWQRTGAAVDAVDALAAVAAARDLPLRGTLAVAVLGGGSAVLGFRLADQLGAG